MLTILIRTVLIYFLLLLIMRIMGKRQLGELELSELIITLLLSEIATAPITSPEIPLSYAIIPILVLTFLEIGTSFIMMKSPLVKKILSSSPLVIISKGKISIKAMKRARISLDELLCQIRQSGIYDLCEVDYAILEENGKMSIIPKSIYRQPDFCDLNMHTKDSGIMHILVCDRQANSHTLSIIGKDKEWLSRKLKSIGVNIRDIFCMTIDDAGKLFIQKYDGEQIIR